MRKEKPEEIRSVVDGAARSRKSALSLNDCIYRGPVLLKRLDGILLRTRFQSCLLAADIEKAFLQVLVRESDRDSTRFLWSSEPFDEHFDDHPKVFRFKRV